ncbi:hypothetical protein E2C01_084987 [Portunus trituberculatus]|uniref:Uncharacterized protein n=1 Tax=Portunus trituberculatus TaxID=210409 RepID=A0A5B7IZS0_PORTR|nr:hypothetical protein [Portunus trituberculatus]
MQPHIQARTQTHIHLPVSFKSQHLNTGTAATVTCARVPKWCLAACISLTTASPVHSPFSLTFTATFLQRQGE